ncbi:hypothetical protein Tco_0744147, partial [Tanacetum coccineum]
SAGPSVAADKGKAPMPELDIPAEFLAEALQHSRHFQRCLPMNTTVLPATKESNIRLLTSIFLL